MRRYRRKQSMFVYMSPFIFSVVGGIIGLGLGFLIIAILMPNHQWVHHLKNMLQ